MDTKTYEIGYLLLPLISAEELEAKTAELIKTAIEANSATVVSQLSPKMRALAYPISKFLNKKNTPFREAYFGSVRFDATPADALKIKTALDKNENIIRHLLVIIPKVTEKPLSEGSALRRRIRAQAPKTEGAPVGEGMTSEAIDKEIEGLLANAEA